VLTPRSLLLAVTLAIACPALAHASLRVDWTDELITITAETVSRSEVLAAVGRAAGVEIVELEVMAPEPVSMRLSRVPLLDAVRRLIGDVPAVLMEERQPDGELRLVSVWVFARSHARQWAADGSEGGAEADAAMRADTATHALEAADGTALRQALLQSDDEERAQAALDVLEAREPAAMISALLVAARSADAGQRLHALRMLDRAGAVDSSTAIAALDHAMTDDDEAIKAFAIGALAVRGAGGLSVLQRTFRGADRDVRLMVLQAVSERDGDSPLLREAVTDTDAQVRQFATFRLSKTGTPGGGS
jgi:hypothetical protein